MALFLYVQTQTLRRRQMAQPFLDTLGQDIVLGSDGGFV